MTNFDRILAKYQFGFRKGHSPQHCLGLKNLYKAFDSINHELLIAKLNASGFHSLQHKFVSAYLNFRKQKIKDSSTFSDSTNIISAFPQGSIARPVFSMFTIAIYFSKRILLCSPAIQIIIPSCFRTEQRKTNKLCEKHSK